MSAKLTLVSHDLCPYVQRAAIVLAEKGVPFERRWVNLAAKPDWFLAVSPLGKTPVLLAQGEALFESAVICEYLDETEGPRLHPESALERARHRAWMEFGSSVLNSIAGFYSAPDASALEARRTELRHRFEQLEAALDPAGPFFAGSRFSLVDAAFGPVFRYFDVFEALGEPSLFDGLPRGARWRAALGKRSSVRGAVDEAYRERLTRFVAERGSELSRRVATAATVPDGLERLD